jgi:hypothetical protein
MSTAGSDGESARVSTTAFDDATARHRQAQPAGLRMWRWAWLASSVEISLGQLVRNRQGVAKPSGNSSCPDRACSIRCQTSPSLSGSVANRIRTRNSPSASALTWCGASGMAARAPGARTAPPQEPARPRAALSARPPAEQKPDARHNYSDSSLGVSGVAWPAPGAAGACSASDVSSCFLCVVWLVRVRRAAWFLRVLQEMLVLRDIPEVPGRLRGDGRVVCP